MDLGAAAAQHRWRQLIDLISQLPSTSRTWVAMTQDEQVAEELAQALANTPDTGDTRKSISPRDYTAVLAALADIYDLIAAGLTDRKRKPPKYPRPGPSAVARAMARLDADSLHDLIAQMTPHALD